MKNNISTIAIIVILLAAIVGVLTLSSHAVPKKVGDSNMPNLIQKMSTSSAMTVTTASSQILATSTARLYAAFVNDGSNPVYLGLDGNPAAVGAGIRLNASGGAYEINNLNLVTAGITAISSGGNSTVTVTAKQ